MRAIARARCVWLSALRTGRSDARRGPHPIWIAVRTLGSLLLCVARRAAHDAFMSGLSSESPRALYVHNTTERLWPMASGAIFRSSAGMGRGGSCSSNRSVELRTPRPLWLMGTPVSSPILCASGRRLLITPRPAANDAFRSSWTDAHGSVTCLGHAFHVRRSVPPCGPDALDRLCRLRDRSLSSYRGFYDLRSARNARGRRAPLASAGCQDRCAYRNVTGVGHFFASFSVSPHADNQRFVSWRPWTNKLLPFRHIRSDDSHRVGLYQAKARQTARPPDRGPYCE